ncbi:PREDICTED: uncharacterized protein LOC109205978 [Nicotiana attenuata]|uniref:uncharacterized protein LOC109205978 n=1 Tax=Nicotiana attenuata TaxID=49451 RepID=UPI0009049E36|nr:PREDICTED: uncharacterized protein LOC109205978 [Nicotiana attenuata]
MVLTLAASSSWKGRVPFRFFNVWVAHEDFHQIVASIWNSSSNSGSLKATWTKLKALKIPLKALNAKDFKGITQRIEKARLELKEIQKQLASTYSDGLLHKEKKTLLNLEKWSLIEESVLQQKERAKWIQLGDFNTKYFTTVMKERSQSKQIREITNGLGDRVTDSADIKREILGFYKALMCSIAKSLPAINSLYMANGPTLSQQQKMELCAEVTDQEILESLKAIGDDKAPVIDGYNAVFFKKAWSIISSQVKEAINEFFLTAKMYKPVNCSNIILVPKVSKPTTVKDYRPIACCSMLYKMISKILAARLQKVMPSIICEAQDSFVPGRKIADNVMEEIGFPTSFIKWTMECIKTVSYTVLYFSQFSEASGLQANLGIPLSTKKIALIQWQPLVDKITAKISSWTAKKLSYAGRVQLVQSMIFGIQAYWAQLFILPVKVMKMIEAICRSYIWSGSNTITKKAYVSWERMCTSKSAGGLNLINLLLWNKAAIAKVCWDLAHKEDKFWIRWINAYYDKQQLKDMPIPKQASWMVRRISASRDILQQAQSSNDHIGTIRQLYLQLLGDLPRVSWKNLLFRNSARPKAVFNLWLLLQGRLPTKDRLVNWGLSINQHCVLCQGHVETRDHLFLLCSYTTMLWKQVMRWIQEDQSNNHNWDQHLQWIINKAKVKSSRDSIFRLVVTEVSYALWMKRNTHFIMNIDIVAVKC